MSVRFVSCLTLMALHSTGSFGGDWTQFRGPGGLGISDERGTPVAWSSTQGNRTSISRFGSMIASFRHSSRVRNGDDVFG